MIRSLLIVALASLNLRTALAAMGAGASELTSVMSGSATVGAVSTISIFMVALAAPVAGALTRHFAIRHMVLASLLGTVVAFVLLGVPHPMAIWTAALLAGLSSGLCGTLLPGIMRDVARNYVGRAAATMMASSALGLLVASVSVTWAIARMGSWVASLAILAGAALLAAAFWAGLTRTPENANSRVDPRGDANATWWRVAYSAWRVQWIRSLTIFVGIQSFVLFAQLAWVTHSAVSLGVGLVEAGGLLSVFTGLQVVGGVIAPWLLDRGASLRSLLLTTSGAIIVGTAIFTIVVLASAGGGMALLIAACFALAIGHGGAYAVANAILASASRSANDSAINTSVVMFLSQTAGALGPVVIGWVFDSFPTARAPWMLMLALCIALLGFGGSTAARLPRVRAGHTG